MDDRSLLSDLLVHVEGAGEPDRDLDQAIAVALSVPIAATTPVPAITESLEVAVELMKSVQGERVDELRLSLMSNTAQIIDPAGRKCGSGKGASPALALVSALLRSPI